MTFDSLYGNVRATISLSA